MLAPPEHGGIGAVWWSFTAGTVGEDALRPVVLVGDGDGRGRARLKDEPLQQGSVHYSFDLWGQQVADFCRSVINRPVLLVGNSIGGVVALRAAQLLNERADLGPCCGGVVL